MSIHTTSRMEKCFSGEVARECHVCPGSPKWGGTCCFGTGFEQYSKECRECVHFDECEEYTRFGWEDDVEEEQPSPHFSPRPRRVQQKLNLNRPAVRPRNLTGRTVTTPPKVVVRSAPVEEGEPMLHRLGKDAVWGLLSGMFEAVSHFFHNNHWR